MANRWWMYQRERFPVFTHGLLIAAVSSSAVSYSYLLRDGAGFPSIGAVIVAFASSFLFFLQLRIADEFKDYEEDLQYRPYRPVPRGLVTLRELGLVGSIGVLIQLGLALWLSPPKMLNPDAVVATGKTIISFNVALGLPALLFLVWFYLALMSKEFFVHDWIRARPFTYMLTHMLIVPLIVFYASACDWLAAGTPPPAGLSWLALSAYFNGAVVEIGRKIRATTDEQRGVQTYTSLWGRRNAVLSWLAALGLTAVCALQAAEMIDFATPVLGVLSILLITAVVVVWRFLQAPVTKRATLFGYLSGVWTLAMYLGLGPVPLLLRSPM